MFTSHASRRTAVAGLAAATLMGAAACGSGSADDGAKGTTKVVAGFYPMAWLSSQIGGAGVAVETLAKPGAEPHDLELTPRQVVDIGEAKLVVYVKGVQPAVDQAVQQQAKDHSLNAASVVKTLPPPAEDGHEHGEEGHKEDVSYDPHIWLDPSRMATVATRLGDDLAKADPGHAVDYRARAKTTAAELTKLDGEFHAGLTTCKQKTIVTSHAAFGYLAERYGLKQVAIAGVDPDSEPSPGRVAELVKEIKSSGATTVFTETLVSPKVAQALAKDAGVKTATLDPVEGVAEGSRDDYLSIMRQNLQTLRTALSCS